MYKLPTIRDYEALIGKEAVDRIVSKAERLGDLHVVHINSTLYGGGVSEILSSLTHSGRFAAGGADLQVRPLERPARGHPGLSTGQTGGAVHPGPFGQFRRRRSGGGEIYESLLRSQDERLLILSCQDSALVNALQRRAAVVLQKSVREGFGLTVAEAMLKGTPVIGGKVGGISHQIDDGSNGFLVASPEEAAERIVMLLKDEQLRKEMGRLAREKVLGAFLLSRLTEQYLDLFASFQSNFSLTT